jgi:hypothetical protein
LLIASAMGPPELKQASTMTKIVTGETVGK